jgi:hypothetical protein
MMDYYNNSYSNKFLISVPKKQAKSYEIDLGQNNGAYNEELLIRYGDNTLNQMKSKKDRAGKLDMDDIMKMNEQLRPFQERPKDEEGVVSFGTMCERIEEKIGNVDDNSEYLTNFEKDLNKAIEVMTNDIFKYFDDTYNAFNPELLEKYKYLKSQIKEQKDENANLLKQIDLLLQENTQIMDLVYKVGSRLENLEKKAGLEKPNVEEEKNSEPEDSEEVAKKSENDVSSGENGEEDNYNEQIENEEREENEINENNNGEEENNKNEEEEKEEMQQSNNNNENVNNENVNNEEDENGENNNNNLSSQQFLEKEIEQEENQKQLQLEDNENEQKEPEAA